MTLRRLDRPVFHLQRQLEADLAAAMSDPNDTLDPAVFVEGGTDDAPSAVFVVWTKWAPLDELKRSEIVLNAYEQAFGIEKTLKVTVAMGLTPEQAEDLKVGT